MKKKFSLRENIQTKIEGVFHPKSKIRAKKGRNYHHSKMTSIMGTLKMIKGTVKVFSSMPMAISIEESFTKAIGTEKDLCFT